MAKKPSGLGRGLDQLLEDNTPRRIAQKGQKPLVEAKDEFVASTPKTSAPAPKTPPQKSPATDQTKQQAHNMSLYQNKVKPLYNTQRTTLKANFKNNLKNKDTR